MWVPTLQMFIIFSCRKSSCLCLISAWMVHEGGCFAWPSWLLCRLCASIMCSQPSPLWDTVREIFVGSLSDPRELWHWSQLRTAGDISAVNTAERVSVCKASAILQNFLAFLRIGCLCPMLSYPIPLLCFLLSRGTGRTKLASLLDSWLSHAYASIDSNWYVDLGSHIITLELRSLTPCCCRKSVCILRLPVRNGFCF